MTPTTFTKANLDLYVNSGRKSVGGWFGRVDAEIFSHLLLTQEKRAIEGGVAEIGVHHGKSFIPLGLSLSAKEKAYCIDVFDDQTQNVDMSGKGDYDIFLTNLSRFPVPKDRVVIVRGSSLDLKPNDIIDKVGLVRFFSVDGGHWHEIVRNDLEIALEVGNNELIIALDDFLHKEWPGVTTGFLEFFAAHPGEIEPFAIGENKLYLARPGMAQTYKSALEDNRLLRYSTNKTDTLCGIKVPIFQGLSGSRVRKAKKYMEIFHPGVFGSVRHLKQTVLGKA